MHDAVEQFLLRSSLHATRDRGICPWAMMNELRVSWTRASSTASEEERQTAGHLRTRGTTTWRDGFGLLFIFHVLPNWAQDRSKTQTRRQAQAEQTQREKPVLSGQGLGRRELQSLLHTWACTGLVHWQLAQQEAPASPAITAQRSFQRPCCRGGAAWTDAASRCPPARITEGPGPVPSTRLLPCRGGAVTPGGPGKCQF